jgi:hypothetical protein
MYLGYAAESRFPVPVARNGVELVFCIQPDGGFNSCGRSPGA